MNNYFNEKTRAVILNYQKNERNIDDDNYLYEVFYIMAEANYHMHRYTNLLTYQDTIIHDCVVHLFNIIKTYNPDKCTNSFSYFNLCCIRFYQQQSIRLTKFKHISMDDPDFAVITSPTDRQHLNYISTTDSIDDTIDIDTNTVFDIMLHKIHNMIDEINITKRNRKNHKYIDKLTRILNKMLLIISDIQKDTKLPVYKYCQKHGIKYAQFRTYAKKILHPMYREILAGNTI